MSFFFRVGEFRSYSENISIVNKFHFVFFQRLVVNLMFLINFFEQIFRGQLNRTLHSSFVAVASPVFSVTCIVEVKFAIGGLRGFE